jgi:hypothetical protein
MAQETVLLLIVYDRAVDTDLMQRLEALGIEGYTKLHDAEGKGGRGIKQGDPIFPGLNNLLLIATTPEKAATIAQTLRAMQDEYAVKPGISIWQLPAHAL